MNDSNWKKNHFARHLMKDSIVGNKKMNYWLGFEHLVSQITINLFSQLFKKDSQELVDSFVNEWIIFQSDTSNIKLWICTAECLNYSCQKTNISNICTQFWKMIPQIVHERLESYEIESFAKYVKFFQCAKNYWKMNFQKIFISLTIDVTNRSGTIESSIKWFIFYRSKWYFHISIETHHLFVFLVIRKRTFSYLKESFANERIVLQSNWSILNVISNSSVLKLFQYFSAISNTRIFESFSNDWIVLKLIANQIST